MKEIFGPPGSLPDFDCGFTLDAHVKSLFCYCFYPLRNIAILSSVWLAFWMEEQLFMPLFHYAKTCFNTQNTSQRSRSKCCCRASEKIHQVFNMRLRSWCNDIGFQLELFLGVMSESFCTHNISGSSLTSCDEVVPYSTMQTNVQQPSDLRHEIGGLF